MKLILTILILLSTSLLHAGLVVDDNMRAVLNGADIGTVSQAVANKTITADQAIAAMQDRYLAVKTAKDAAIAATAKSDQDKAAIESSRIALIQAVKTNIDDPDKLDDITSAAELSDKQKRLAEIAEQQKALAEEAAKLQP